MAKKLDRTTAAAAREDARRLEAHADSTAHYPADTVRTLGYSSDNQSTWKLCDGQARPRRHT